MEKSLCLCWLLVAIVHMTCAGLSDNFMDCLQNFYRNQPPVGFQGIAFPSPFNSMNPKPDVIRNDDLTSPAYICQQVNNLPNSFATLYDWGRRIPLYSAYILERRPQDGTPPRGPNTFRVEPQLIYRQLETNMLLESDARQAIKNYNIEHNISEREERNRQTFLLRTSQAIDEDYTNSGYQRGHLNPNGHHVQEGARLVTFTLTNVAPMTERLNTVWSLYENNMIGYSQGCATVYVVTGIVPGNNWIRSDRVNIPSHVWNAVCCVNNNNQPPRSWAALAAYDNPASPVQHITITQLQTDLRNLLPGKPNIRIFENNCA
ncbi:endonuclease domain-containing 1 protein-like [Ascaphus truei]|uniref:endonuclease domain-containing 1 protein-like n=1 Tax=Ascaphus truei TaxID=8439 RepID=UPI003F596DA7